MNKNIMLVLEYSDMGSHPAIIVPTERSEPRLDRMYLANNFAIIFTLGFIASLCA